MDGDQTQGGDHVEGDKVEEAPPADGGDDAASDGGDEGGSDSE